MGWPPGHPHKAVRSLVIRTWPGSLLALPQARAGPTNIASLHDHLADSCEKYLNKKHILKLDDLSLIRKPCCAATRAWSLRTTGQRIAENSMQPTNGRPSRGPTGTHCGDQHQSRGCETRSSHRQNPTQKRTNDRMACKVQDSRMPS